MVDPTLLHTTDIMNGRVFDLRIFRTKEDIPLPCSDVGFEVLIYPIPTIITRYIKPYIKYPLIQSSAYQNTSKNIKYEIPNIVEDLSLNGDEFAIPSVSYKLIEGEYNVHSVPSNTYHQEIRNKIFTPKFIDDTSYFYDLNSMNINYVCNPKMTKQYHHIYNDLYLVIDYSALREYAIAKNLVVRKRRINITDRRNITLITGYNQNAGYPIAKYYNNVVNLIEGEVQYFGPENLETCINIDGSYSVEYFNMLEELKTLDYYFYNTDLVKAYIFEGDIQKLIKEGFVVNPILKDSIKVVEPSEEIKWSRYLNYSNTRRNRFYHTSTINYEDVKRSSNKHSIYKFSSNSGKNEEFNFRMIQEFYAKGILYSMFPGMYSPNHQLVSAFRATLSSVTNQGNNTAGIFNDELDQDHGNTTISRKYDCKLDVYYKGRFRPRARPTMFTHIALNQKVLGAVVYTNNINVEYNSKLNLNELLYFKNQNNNRSAKKASTLSNMQVNSNFNARHIQLPIVNYEQHLKKNILKPLKENQVQHIDSKSLIQNTNGIKAEYYDTTCYKHREFMLYIFEVFNEEIVSNLKTSTINIGDKSRTVTFQKFKHFADLSQRMAYLIWRDFKEFDDIYLTKEEFCEKYHEYGLTYDCHEYPTGRIASLIKRTMNQVYDKELDFRKMDSIIEPTVSQKIIPILHEKNVASYDRTLTKESYEFTIDQKNVAIRARYIKPLNEITYDKSLMREYPIVRNPFMMFQIHNADWCRRGKHGTTPVRISGCTWIVDGSPTTTTSTASLCLISAFGSMCNNDPVPDIPKVPKPVSIDEECTDDVGGGGTGGGRPSGPSGPGPGTGNGCDVRFHKCTGTGGPWHPSYDGDGGGEGTGGSGGTLPPDWDPGDLIPSPFPDDPPPIFGMIYFANTIAGHIPSILREIQFIPVVVEPPHHNPKSIIFPVKPIIEKIERPEYKIEFNMIPYWIVEQVIDSGAVHEIHASALNSRHIYHTRFFMPEFTKFESSNKAFMQESFVNNLSVVMNSSDKLKRDSNGNLTDLARWLEFTKVRTLVNIETNIEILEDVAETTNIIMQSFVDDSRIYSDTVTMIPDIVKISNYVSELNVIIEPSSNLGTSKSMTDLLFKISNNLRDRIKLNLLISEEMTDVSLQFVSKIESLNKFIYPFKNATGIESAMERFKSLGLIEKIIPMIYSTSFPTDEFARYIKFFKDEYGIEQIIIHDADSIAMSEEWQKYFRENRLQ